MYPNRTGLIFKENEEILSNFEIPISSIDLIVLVNKENTDVCDLKEINFDLSLLENRNISVLIKSVFYNERHEEFESGRYALLSPENFKFSSL